jgi:predicted amidohydrolase
MEVEFWLRADVSAIGQWLTVAAGQPQVTLGDVASNIAAHAEMVAGIRADLWIFPELSITGYSMSAAIVDGGDEVFRPLSEVCAQTGATALVGAPVREHGNEYVATLSFTRDAVAVAYRKQWLGASEAKRFTAGPSPAYVEVSGWRVALGICKDTGEAEHHRAVSALSPDVYAAGLVHHDHELGEQDRRGLAIVEALSVPVVFASFAGETGEGYTLTAGTSTVWDRDGGLLARSGPSCGEAAVATLTGRCAVDRAT